MKRIQFAVTDEEYEVMFRYARHKRYHCVGHLALFALERYIRAYPISDEDRMLGLNLDEIGK